MNTDAETSPPNPVEVACVAVGGSTALARKLGVSTSVISNWKTRGVPAERVLDVERAAEGKVTRYQIRPDVFGPPPATVRRKLPRRRQMRKVA